MVNVTTLTLLTYMVNINDCSGVVRVHMSCCVRVHMSCCVFMSCCVHVHMSCCVYVFTVCVKTYYIYALGGGAYATG